MSDLYVHRDKRRCQLTRKASRSDVLEWLGGLTRYEKLELLEWEKCEDCGGSGVWDCKTCREAGHEDCRLLDSCELEPHTACLDGLVPPASQVEAGGKAWRKVTGALIIDLVAIRAALIAAMEGVGDE